MAGQIRRLDGTRREPDPVQIVPGTIHMGKITDAVEGDDLPWFENRGC